MTKPRVLYLCGHSPWPRNGGALLRNYWLIAALSRRYAVDLVVSEAPAGDPPPEFAAMIDDYACFSRAKGEREGLGRLMRAASPRESTLTAGWTSPALRDYVAERLGHYPYAAIQADLPMYGALPRRDAIPIVYNAHNCESMLLNRRSKTEPQPMGAALAIESLRVRRLEMGFVARASLVAACSESDVLDFERLAPGMRAKTAIVPNGVDLSTYRGVRNAPSQPKTVLITGSMDWRPNVMGLRWFLRSVLPALRACVPDVVVRVAGRMGADTIAELRACANVEAVPNPESMQPHLAAATVVAAPIVSSSGTRLRILEAWASGRAVVTTTAGAFGLDCESGVELKVHDDPVAFAQTLASLLSIEELRSALVANALRRAQQYDWHAIGTSLLEAYDTVVRDPYPAHATPFSGVGALARSI